MISLFHWFSLTAHLPHWASRARRGRVCWRSRRWAWSGGSRGPGRAAACPGARAPGWPGSVWAPCWPPCSPGPPSWSPASSRLKNIRLWKYQTKLSSSSLKQLRARQHTSRSVHMINGPICRLFDSTWLAEVERGLFIDSHFTCQDRCVVNYMSIGAGLLYIFGIFQGILITLGL